MRTSASRTLLDDVIASYLRTLSEFDFFDAFGAILRANGFYDIHRTHGSGELGRDFIAKRYDNGVVRQYGIQNKAGNIGLPGWREVRNQIEDIRLNQISNPNFDSQLPRVAVLALTGRLVGVAPSSAHDYKLGVDTDSFVFEVWPLEHLVSMMADSPEVGLAGDAEAPILGAIAAIHVRMFGEDALDRLSLDWIGADESGLWRSALVALVISARLAVSGRTDLAALTGVHLVRAAWASVHGEEPPPPVAAAVADVGRGLLVQYTNVLLDELAALDSGAVAFVGATQDVGVIFNYPVRCMRLMELIGLMGLAEEDVGKRSELASVCINFIRCQPGASHPPSDKWAASISPPALLMSEFDPEFVVRWLEQICVWIADHYGRHEFGLAGPLATPDEEVRQLLGTHLAFVDIRRRPESFIASVLLDLTAALGLIGAYDLINNDLVAVDIYPQVVECDDDASIYRDTLEGVYLELWMRYDESYATFEGWECAPHHRRSTPCYLERIGRNWDLLAVCSVMRDRCFPSLIREIANSSR